ncbi:hypothetical protein [Neolewinella antarctica]|uniref:Uncharacterized protein n=1 Tax=Neolewinella antarctica TaxID=442734 RepID=A0ABX0X7Z2_9BACT|nr:hypothetical protein [Neolewinella antarctica]NJC25116.1 hypothetical protein [Neolewinella antarctica]
MTTDEKKERLRQLANVDFPAAAKAGRFPIVLNHCFLRVVYDHVAQDMWKNVLTGKGPAIHQLSGEQLDLAIATGEAMLTDRELTSKLNQESLAFRGKLK